MDLTNKSVAELEERKVAIVAELENTDADLDALEEEARAIKLELETRAAAAKAAEEQRTAIAENKEKFDFHYRIISAPDRTARCLGFDNTMKIWGAFLKTFDDESVVFDSYKLIPSRKIAYNGRFFHCLRIQFLTKCFLFNHSWIDSSDKSLPPPDFHNDRHHIMMEVMRIDDCVNEIDGKHVVNSFERANSFMKKHAGKDYKKKVSRYFFWKGYNK